MLKRVATFAAASAAALLMSLTMSTPAQASDSWHEMYTDDGGRHGGKVTFKEYGDVVTLCDRDADGRFVTLYVTTVDPISYRGYMLSTEGQKAGFCITSQASQGRPHDMWENKTYKFEIDLSGSGGYDSALWHNDH